MLYPSLLLLIATSLIRPSFVSQPLEESLDGSETIMWLGSHHPRLSYFSHSCTEPPTVSILIFSLSILEFFDFRIHNFVFILYVNTHFSFYALM